MEVKELVKKSPNRASPEVYDEKLKKMRREYDKMCKGMFEFLDAQGGWLDFSYRFFKGEPVRTVRITHGEICDLPMGLVRHLNNCKKKIRKFGTELTERGLPSSFETISRIRFTPVDMF